MRRVAGHTASSALLLVDDQEHALTTKDLSEVSSLESPVGPHVIIDGRRYINFGGSSYLGLAAHSAVVEAGIAALRQYGSGAPLARDQRVSTPAHAMLESEASDFFASPSVLYLASGYLFGLVALAAVRQRYSVVFFDEYVHYSLREAIGASGLTSHAFHHLDAEHLERLLKQQMGTNDRALVATDGLYSTLGEIAPLNDLLAAVAPYGGRLLVDESHSFGVLGSCGRGAWEHHGLPISSVLLGGSLAKGFGTCGGIILGSESEVAAFRATPTAVGSSVGLAASAAMCARSLGYVREHPELLQQLRANVAHIKSGFRKLGLPVLDNCAPVAAFTHGSWESMQELQHRLMSLGIFVYHSTYVGAAAAGVIRCAVFANHTSEHIDVLLDALQRVL